MKSEDVIAWREALTRLADQHFFDLIRMYIGAVRTPFNKQRLIEELSAFLRKPENRAAILDGLDELDIRILSAIVELPQATQQKIVSLFAPSRSFPEIYERVLNLEERLLIYRRGDTSTREYAINPLLSDYLAPRIGMRHLTGPLALGASTTCRSPPCTAFFSMAASRSRTTVRSVKKPSRRFAPRFRSCSPTRTAPR
jgi:hypothetical protein